MIAMPEIYDAAKGKGKQPIKRKPSDYSEVIRNFAHAKGLLSAFVVQPTQVRMGIQQSDEKILLLLRRHWITNVKWITIFGLMLIGPVMLSVFVDQMFLPSRFMTATVVLWYLLTFGIALEGFLSWFYNVFIITDERIIDVDFVNLIYKNISAAKIDNIEDVTVQMGGAIRNVLNFGTVLVQTAGEKTQFEFEDVPNPQEVAKFINELMLEEEQEKLEGRAK